MVDPYYKILYYLLIPTQESIMKKQAKSFTLSPKVIEKLKKFAKQENRSESQVVDMILSAKLLA